MEEKHDFKKELDFILSTKIFFKKPSNDRILLFTFLYIFFTILGSVFGFYLVTSLFTLPLLVYLLSAKGTTYYIPLSVLSIFYVYLTSSLNAVAWNFIHIILAVIIYRSIKNRYPKILILMSVSGFIFLSISLYLHLLFSTGIVNFSPQGIQNFINAYILEISSLQPNTDVEVFREAFELLKRYIPSLAFLGIVVYSLFLINYTFFVLAKEKAIVPIFPDLKLMGVGRSVAYVYMLITLILTLIISVGTDTYDPYYLFFDNLYSIFRWIFVFNGVCTVFFFIEDRAKPVSGLLKPVTLVTAYLFSGLFDIIGLIDSLVRLRESYVRMKGGK